MSKQQDELRRVSIESMDTALDKLIEWILGHDENELANIDFRKIKREVLITAEAAIDSEVQAALDRVEASNLKGMYIDPHKTAGVLVAEHRIDVQNVIEEVRKDYE